MRFVLLISGLAAGFGLAALLAASTPVVGAEPADGVEIYRTTLIKHGFLPTTAGALDYLRRIELDEKQQERITALVHQMGDRNYRRREAATHELTLLPAPNRELTRAIESENPEIRWRAKLVVQKNQHDSSAMLTAALKLVAHDPSGAGLEDLLPALPWCQAAHMRLAAQAAMLAVAAPQDYPRLKELLTSGEPAERVAAFYVLSQKLPAEEHDLLRAVLKQSDDQVVLAAAKMLADIGDRASLPALIRLLESPDDGVRVDAIGALRAFTGQYFAYQPHKPPAEQVSHLTQWRDWLAEHGADAELRFPLGQFRDGRGDLGGNTLVATGSAGKVLELDPSGKIVWSFDISSWSAEKLPNGNVLIASYASNRVVVVDREGKVVWEMPSINAMTARPLRGGNFLLADFNGNRVIEVNEAKATVWEHKTPDNCFDAFRLPSGNTIFGCPNLVQEVSADGELVREWKIPGRLNGFQPLPNGNLLIANYGEGKITELSPSGKVLWEFAETGPCDVFRLADGGMLVTTSSHVIEVGPDLKVVKEIVKSNYGSARR
ncbi:outer membrane protein assembly factor BamB family protein [Lignipirellula cremea]|uniref:Pyrrolo-quinoline quinone repeat domain-containing protein n=1 Tax=Lignipirellula cremea TaxID=2528010 RepID=A0A518DV49_9BACT|nr:PQQ-binding-like beta-propeller repeat protein [Lignipirellula cremea]QDU95716.1 hypothetical protein Pla8534_35330 [Lignipirellula cremea]